MLCIYHIADHDGKGSGAVVKSVYPEIKLLGLNHDMEIPYDEIERHEMVVVCDFALPVDYMFELSKRKDFTWIDHHASVIEEYEKALKAGAEPIKGLRRTRYRGDRTVVGILLSRPTGAARHQSAGQT